MAGGKEQRARRLVELQWNDGETVVDVGGGNGAFLIALLDGLPALRGIVFDLPETVRDEGVLGDRIEFVEGSFFESVPAGDVYVLGRILHDWDDERRDRDPDDDPRDQLAPGARLLLFESVIPPGNDPSGAKWLDLLMLVLSAGRERTEDGLAGAARRDRASSVASIEDGLIQARCP